jgi:NADPH-dependent stearoyl-CoA 9-desaturase
VPEVETKPDWNLGQMLGTASFQAGTVIAFVSGNLCYRIEYDRFPDPPSNRDPEIAERLRAFCRTYDRPGDSV